MPIGVKELERVEGWPASDASLVFADRAADHSTTMVRRLEAAGVVKVGQTVASEFGGLNVSTTGCTASPTTPGSTAAPPADRQQVRRRRGRRAAAHRHRGRRGGSIRIPAGFCGVWWA